MADGRLLNATLSFLLCGGKQFTIKMVSLEVELNDVTATAILVDVVTLVVVVFVAVVVLVLFVASFVQDEKTNSIAATAATMG